MIFTCLTSRAVHLEVAHALDADSCVNAIRRFICRRGPVSSIRSDKSTHIVGANRELKESDHLEPEQNPKSSGPGWNKVAFLIHL